MVRENGSKHEQSIIIVDDQNKRITYAESTARGDALIQEEGPLQASSAAQFFAVLEECVDTWGDRTNFCQALLNNPVWRMKLCMLSRKVKRIVGSAESVPSGDVIRNEVVKLCCEAGLRSVLKRIT